ncbi:MgtC family membrane protein [Aureimonas endophytica]|uniref:Protein MgtC n=1 Tax=Aureimonas endophytica TaxID=2027858 RepID=A0A916ZPB1_9HYPH|nr:MgtC/SapB family protein [Aureimonas endophytica]GGE05386.1 MgtC family membrane protein [Aureimonas endophytica]
MISNGDIVLRLLMAAVLGSLIGFERERLLWSAGIRTHMLVGVGACLFMIVSAYGFQNATRMEHVVLDPSRIAAQVVSGVGFLGAGAILLKGNVVRGLTTAASVWAVAALGLAAGGGLYFAAAAATFIILVILAGIKPLEEAYRTRLQACIVQIRADHGALSTADVKAALRLRGGQIKRVTQTIGPDGKDDLVLHLARVAPSRIHNSVGDLAGRPGVHSATVERPNERPS